MKGHRSICAFLSLSVMTWVLLWSAIVQAEQSQWYRVRWVADGDTIILSDGRHVRYLGIDAPETAHDDRPTQPFGRAAQKYNRQLVHHQMVRLEFDRERRDQYGRWLCHIHRRDGLWVNHAMVVNGLAIYLFTTQNTRHGQTLLAAQRTAMQHRRGLWQPGPNATVWRGRFLGNRRSQRFHAADCALGQQISRRNRIWFDSQWEAYYAGYAPGRQCLGRTPGATPQQRR